MDASDLLRLRLDLANQGLRISDELLEAGFALMLAADGLPGGAEGIDLILPGEVWTNVSVAPGYARTSPYRLDGEERDHCWRFTLRHRSKGTWPVEVPDTSRFRAARTHTGFSCGEIGAIHGPWLVCAPILPRGDLGLDRPRRFVGLPPNRTLAKARWSVDEVVSAAEAGWRHGGVRLVHLEASHVLADDGGIAELLPYVQALKRALPTLVSLSALPPTDPSRVVELYAAGVDALSYHLLAFDQAAAARAAPVRARFVPHDRLRAGLRAAARIFPTGAVSTDLLVGLEPLDHLEPAMAELCANGVVPNLTVFRPLPGAEDDAPGGDLVPTEPLIALIERRRSLIQQHGLFGSPVRGFPRTLAGIDPYRPGFTHRAYAGLRRWLRLAPAEAA